MRNVVVLPDPLGPTSPQKLPVGTSRSSEPTATWSPNRLCSPRATIAGQPGTVSVTGSVWRTRLHHRSRLCGPPPWRRSSPMAVGVYPGSFDPLTVAHLTVAHCAVRQLELERIDLAISRSALGKAHLGADTLADRVAAIERAAASRPWLGVVVLDASLVADIASGYDAVVMGADKWAQVVDAAWYGDDPAARDAALAASAPGGGRAAGWPDGARRAAPRRAHAHRRDLGHRGAQRAHGVGRRSDRGAAVSRVGGWPPAG